MTDREDAVVSGETTPDEFIAAANGEVRARPGAAGSACLSDDEVRAVAALARRIAAAAGAPQDIEWALDAAGLWLLQARPMTALPEPVRWDSPVPGAKWMKDLMAAESYLCFGPDSLAEARNRGYRLFGPQRGTVSDGSEGATEAVA